MKNSPPYLKRDNFYLLEFIDTNTEINRKISIYMNKVYIPFYIGPNDKPTRNPCDAQISKSEKSSFRKSVYLKTKYTTKIVELNREEFLSLMESNSFSTHYTSIRNKKLYHKEKNYRVSLHKYRKDNNFGPEYSPPENLDMWPHCPVCERKPLINKQEDVTYISCGCHKDGELLTIPCKNNLEPVTPLFTWNHWVKNSTLLFSDI